MFRHAMHIKAIPSGMEQKVITCSGGRRKDMEGEKIG